MKKVCTLFLFLFLIEGTFAMPKELKIGGRIMNDWLITASGQDVEYIFGPFTTGTEFRRARIFVSGKLKGNVTYKIQLDFAKGSAQFKDVYIGMTKVPFLGTITIGHQKEPFSLEELTSSKYITFLERSLPNVFVPSRNTGILFSNHLKNKRMTWAWGFFRDANGSGKSIGNGGWSMTGRLTFLPLYRNDGKTVWHLGLAGSFRDTLNDIFRVKARPEVHLAPTFLDTSELPVQDTALLGFETAFVFGAFSIQSEYILQSVRKIEGDTPDLQGFYVYASLFLTGEHRPYKTSSGVFGRVHPKKPLGEHGGLGALELVARFSYLDLESGSIQAGVLRNFSFGLNWYLNAHTRVMVQAVASNVLDTGTAFFFATRFQVDF